MIVSREPQPLAPQRRTVSVLPTSSVALMTLLLFMLAIIPRALAPGSFVTVDEYGNWLGRSYAFLQALQAGDYASTNQNYQPGVTTMWLGAVAMRLHQVLMNLSGSSDHTFFMTVLRFPVALVTSFCVALAYPLLHRLFGGRVALLAALFSVLNPFMVAHSKILHTDALATSLITLALLAALVAFRIDNNGTERDPPVHWGMLVASAIAGGLAILSKLPGVFLLPMVGLIALVGMWRYNHRPPTTDRKWRCNILRVYISRLVAPLLVWLGMALATIFVLWPALWVEPLEVVDKLILGVWKGGTPHEGNTFFMGQPVADPGPWFYPVAIALRLTPWTMLGLLTAAFLAGYKLLRRTSNRVADGAPSAAVSGRRSLALLALFAVLFIAIMSLQAKKFDRYALPVFPALDIIAAAGWIGLIRILDFRFWTLDRDHPQSTIHNPKLIWFLIVLLLALNLAWYHPYELAYYNPLLGGGPAAERTLLVGWGEGMDQVGAYIAAHTPDCDNPIALSVQPFLLEHFVCNPITGQRYALDPDRGGYAVLYISHVQRNRNPQTTAFLEQTMPLAHIVRIHGINYAYIYKLIPPVARPLAADFGDAIHLRGYDLDASAVRAGGALTLTLQWQGRAPMSNDYALFVHVLGDNGQLVAHIDVPLGAPQAPTSAWWPDRYVTTVHHIPLQSPLQAGTYWIALGAYHPGDLARLPLRTLVTQPDAPDDGSNALLLEPLSLP